MDGEGKEKQVEDQERNGGFYGDETEGYDHAQRDCFKEQPRTRRLLSNFICSLPFLVQSAALRRIPYKVKFQF